MIAEIHRGTLAKCDCPTSPASMRPRSYDRGNLLFCPEPFYAASSVDRFNEAAIL